MLKFADCPFWPRYLTRETAALYLGVSTDTFDNEVRAGFWPPPRRRGGRGGRLTWDRAMIDAVADRASGITEQGKAGEPVAADPPSARNAATDEGAFRAAFSQNRSQRQPQKAR